jgi:hypothetical protein
MAGSNTTAALRRDQAKPVACIGPRRFPPPWSVEELDACYVVRDHNEQAVAYVYFADEQDGISRQSKLRHLIVRRHHEGGFAGLIHAAEPTCVERRTAFLLFLEGILPDLHRLAAAWARITVTGDDDAQLSNPLPLQIVPA